MAVFAALWLERSLVRVYVAVGALGELHVFVAHRSCGKAGLVALLASDLNVLAGQRIASLGMIEPVGRLPIGEVVALQTVIAELAFVRIFVARRAIWRQAKKGLGEILVFDQRPLFRNHVHGRVTFFTGDAGVLSFEVVAG